MNNREAIGIKGLSKRYRMGEVNGRTLIKDINLLLNRFPGKRLSGRKGRSECNAKRYIWSLKDINLSIGHGEVFGIIGSNGAGKSTLLKILSRITSPTEGEIRISGKVSSLLEVGTGFHPELTGRENIYLNGAIQGLKRKEINDKLDRIIEFSGVTSFIDTPVKRYSSGMKVRLGFSVAAHLEPDILIIDEVLAVGDFEFQNRCLKKIRDVASSGKTIIMVSHNLSSIANMCIRAAFLKEGRLIDVGETDDVISSYLNMKKENDSCNLVEVRDRAGKGEAKFVKAEVLDGNYGKIEYLKSGEKAQFQLVVRNITSIPMKSCRVSMVIRNGFNDLILLSSEFNLDYIELPPGDTSMIFSIENLPLADGEYHASLFIESAGELLDWVEDGLRIRVLNGDFYETKASLVGAWKKNVIMVKQSFEIQR